MKATFKGYRKGTHEKWILVDMHNQPPWVNKLLFPPAIKNKRSEPPMTNRLDAQTKRVAELHQVSLEACHCIEEFYLWRIRPLGHRKKLALECLRLADPHRESLEGYPFDFSLYC
jgi:hypothetical protein